MASITSWVRIEPRARDADLSPGAEARLHDPLWLLARQYQLGELAGVDAGSAIVARTRLEVARVEPLDPLLSDAPATVERRARDGRLLQIMLAPDDAAVFAKKFALAVDPALLAAMNPAARRFCTAMIGRVPDGDAVAAAIEPILAAGDFTTSFGLASPDLAAVSATCRTWLARRDAAGRTNHGTWQGDRLAYAFEARTRMATLAANHHAGDATWRDVDALPPYAGDPPATTSVVSTTIPAHVRYRGAPARRYWDLEDSAVVWPALTAGPGDVGRLLAIELGLTFADDWLVVPVELDAGSLARVRSHVVTDTFGVRQLVRATAEIDGDATPWHFCELTRDATLAGPLLFVPATAPALVGPVVDAIAFASDDVADVLWAIDRTILGDDGIARPAPTPAETARVTTPLPVYVLGPSLPVSAHPYRMRTAATGPELALTVVPGTVGEVRPEFPRRIALGALPKRPVELRVVASLRRTSNGSYQRVIRHDVVDTQPPALPPLAFDQVR